MPRPFLFLVALAACGDDLPGYDLYEDEPETYETISVWVQPHADVPAETARQACEAWRPEGVRCALVDDPQEALLRIRAVDGPCEKRDDGQYVLGRAWVGGEVALMIGCLRKFGGTPVGEDLLWPVVSHETGHQLGIWTHVPPEDGVALMNPKVHEGLYGITLLDHEAFLAREEDLSILRLADEGCVLTFSE